MFIFKEFLNTQFNTVCRSKDDITRSAVVSVKTPKNSLKTYFRQRSKEYSNKVFGILLKYSL